MKKGKKRDTLEWEKELEFGYQLKSLVLDKI